MDLNSIIFSLFVIFFGYYLNKGTLFYFNKKKINLLIDNKFKKPQAFHEVSTYRLGGAIIYFLLILVFIYLHISKNIFFFEYLSFCTLFFFLGFVDDLRINIPPKFRLLIMIAFLLALIGFNKFYIEKTGLEFLNHLLEIDIFSIFFVLLCFLFIINGANLIDGFNGLLGIHSLIILIVLFLINLINGNGDIANFLFFTSLLILIFLKFNFPRAKLFLGDSGAYLIGALIAVSVIKTSHVNPAIHPFFFCILLFYLFFEVFFSFFRKILFARQSPLLPDNQHLHMLLYKILLKNDKKKLYSNFKVSIFLNLIYFLLITPGIIFIDQGLFCRYYFFSLMFVYIYFYRMLYKKLK